MLFLWLFFSRLNIPRRIYPLLIRVFLGILCYLLPFLSLSSAWSMPFLTWWNQDWPRSPPQLCPHTWHFQQWKYTVRLRRVASEMSTLFHHMTNIERKTLTVMNRINQFISTFLVFSRIFHLFLFSSCFSKISWAINSTNHSIWSHSTFFICRF